MKPRFSGRVIDMQRPTGISFFAGGGEIQYILHFLVVDTSRMLCIELLPNYYAARGGSRRGSLGGGGTVILGLFVKPIFLEV